MKAMLTLWRRELTGYFLSPIAYATLAFFLLVMGLIFHFLVSTLAEGVPGKSVMNLMFGSPFYWMTLMVVIPLLTMRLFAEEKRSGTIETLLTAPVSDAAVVAAKFLGVFCFYALMWLPTTVFIAVLYRYSEGTAPVDAGVLAACYTGVLLSGAFFLSMGLVCSVLTSNQIVAAVACFALMTLVFFSGFGESIHFGRFAISMNDMASPHQQLSEFARGIIDSRSVFFYLSGTFFCLFTATRTLEARCWK